MRAKSFLITSENDVEAVPKHSFNLIFGYFPSPDFGGGAGVGGNFGMTHFEH